MKKWLVPALLISLLIALALSATRWGSVLFGLLSDKSTLIEALTNTVQLVLWISAGIIWLVSFLRGKKPQATPETPSLQTLQMQHIVNLFFQIPGADRSITAAELQGAVSKYLVWVKKRYGQLSLRGIEQREQKALDLTLQDVYVSLAASLAPKRQQQENSMTPKSEGGKQNELIDMRGLLQLSQRLVIIGGPGSGKTTFLHLIASILADALLSENDNPSQEQLEWHGPPPLPIFVSLSEYNLYRRDHSRGPTARQGTLTAFISHSLIQQEAGFGLPDNFFEQLLTHGQQCILLLDGLDEVPTERERQKVSLAIENLADNPGVGRIIVTSRSKAYHGQAVLPEEFRVAEVQPMTPEQVNALAARWCNAVYQPDSEARQETAKLQKEIAHLEEARELRGEARLIDAPLLVTIVAIVHYSKHRLPQERAELYEQCVEVLLAERHHPATDATHELADWGGSPSEKRSWLAFIAYQMMSAGKESGRTVSEESLRKWLLPRLTSKKGADKAEDEFNKFIEVARSRGSLLTTGDGGDFRFIHHTFQEFLGAYYLAENLREVDKIIAFLKEKERVADSWWRETILLLVGYLGLKSPDTALSLIQGLTTLSDELSLSLAGAEVAATGFLELDSRDAATKEILTACLINGVSSSLLTLPARRRAEAGVALGRIGDPRFGVGLQNGLPAIDWITIQPDEFPMGSVKGQEKWPDELPQFPCRLLQQPYRISRYLVTGQQYQSFVAAKGYEQSAYWTKAGWQWRQQENINGPRIFAPVFQTLNHPQVGISWYEADAFCQWLSKMLGVAVFLPSEAQWEFAARANDGRTYPWGKAGDPAHYCNGAGSKIGASSAVGIFPQGNARCGAADMIGNVWEWCATEWLPDYQEYEAKVNNDREGTVRRVVRGGSFYDDEGYLRCAARSLNGPYNRSYFLGFRVCAAPSPLASGAFDL